MSNICAGIGRGQMEVLDAHVALRRKANVFYSDYFASVDGVTVLKEPTGDWFSNHWLTAIVIDEAKVGKTREDLRLAFEAANIESRPLWKPMHLQPVFEHYPYYGKDVSSALFKKGLCLPSSSNLTDEDYFRLENVLDCFFKSQKL